jgi:hypothetical protein
MKQFTFFLLSVATMSGLVAVFAPTPEHADGGFEFLLGHFIELLPVRSVFLARDHRSDLASRVGHDIAFLLHLLPSIIVSARVPTTH